MLYDYMFNIRFAQTSLHMEMEMVIIALSM